MGRAVAGFRTRPEDRRTTTFGGSVAGQVCLITEGTYPFHDGGVSVWCDQLVRGMAPREFVIDAVTTTGSEVSSWDLPTNVVDVRSIPLWGPTTRTRSGPPPDHDALSAVDQALQHITSPCSTADFASSLRALFALAQQGQLREALSSEQAVRLALRALAARVPSGRTVNVLATRATVADAVASLRLLEHLVRPLEVEPPVVDLCHASSNGVGVLVAMAAKWKHGTSFVLTEHGLYLRERYIAYGPTSLPHHQRMFLLGFFKQLTVAAYSMADVIAPGSDYNRAWEQVNGADPARIELIYNGIDAPNFATALPPSVPTITWVGRIDPLKDVKTMLRAFALVRDEMPEARLRLFGGVPKGNEAYMRECLDLHERLSLGDSARFEGRVPSITDAYHAGHVVVSTSISEGLPYSVLEAMACGRALIATNVGGVGEAIADVGVLVPPRNPRAIADACLRVLGDQHLRTQLARRGRRRVRRLFTVDMSNGRYREIYDSLTSTPLEPRQSGVGVAAGRAS